MTVREVLRVSFRPFLERTKEARMNLLLRRKSKIYYFSLFALLQTCNHLCNFFLPTLLELGQKHRSKANVYFESELGHGNCVYI